MLQKATRTLVRWFTRPLEQADGRNRATGGKDGAQLVLSSREGHLCMVGLVCVVDGHSSVWWMLHVDGDSGTRPTGQAMAPHAMHPQMQSTVVDADDLVNRNARSTQYAASHIDTTQHSTRLADKELFGSNSHILLHSTTGGTLGMGKRHGEGTVGATG